MSIIWKDVSSFSQVDKERIPNCFRASAGVVTLNVHRHIYHEKDDWLLSVPGIFDKKLLGKITADEAKKTSEELVKTVLEKTMKEFE